MGSVGYLFFLSASNKYGDVFYSFSYIFGK